MKTAVYPPHRSSFGMDANIAVLVLYIAMAAISWIPIVKFLAWGIPVACFFLEKESKFVKYQAAQALVIGLIQAIIGLILQIIIWVTTPRDWAGALNYALGGGWGIWVLLGTISMIIGLVFMALIVYVMIMAYGYKQVELPLIGPLTAKLARMMDNMGGNKTP